MLSRRAGGLLSAVAQRQAAQGAAGEHLWGVCGGKGGTLSGCSLAEQVLSWPWGVTQSQGGSGSCPAWRLWAGNLPYEWSLESGWGKKRPLCLPAATRLPTPSGRARLWCVRWCVRWYRLSPFVEALLPALQCSTSLPLSLGADSKSFWRILYRRGVEELVFLRREMQTATLGVRPAQGLEVSADVGVSRARPGRFASQAA